MIKIRKSNFRSLAHVLLLPGALFCIFVTSVSSIQVKADYVPGTLTQIARLQHINTSDPDSMKKMILDYTASQEKIPLSQVDYHKSNISVAKPAVIDNSNIELAKINVSLKKKKENTSVSNINVTSQQKNNSNVLTTTPSASPNSTAFVPSPIPTNETSQPQISDSKKEKDTTVSDKSEKESGKKGSVITVEVEKNDENLKKNSTGNTPLQEENTETGNDKVAGTMLTLKTNETTIWNGDVFNPESMIASISTTNGKLPALSIDNKVDSGKDGTYVVTYKAVDTTGKVDQQTLTVKVKTADEVIKKQIEEQRKAEAEAKQKNAYLQEAAQNQIPLNLGAPAVNRSVASLNPYPLAYGYWSNCTWGAWQLVYQNEGIALPGWNNAAEWYYNALIAGYSVDLNPRAGDVAVYGGNSLGHVAYVADVTVDKNHVYVQQGNWAGTYTENWNPRYSTASGMPLLGYIHVR